MKSYSPKISVNIIYEKDGELQSFQIETAQKDTAPLIEDIRRKLPQATLAEFQRDIILMYLKNNDGNRMKTARELGMSIRALRDNLRRFKASGVDVIKPQNEAR